MFAVQGKEVNTVWKNCHMTMTSVTSVSLFGLLTHVSNQLGRLVPRVPALPGFCRIRKYGWLIMRPFLRLHFSS